MDDELTSLLRCHPALQSIDDGKRLQCSLTGHQMPMRADVVRSYVTGKKYKKLFDMQQSSEYEKYKMHLVPSNKKDHEYQLFCKLTLLHVTNSRKHIEEHIAGRKFKKAYAKWLHCQQTGEKFTARANRKSQRIDDDDDDNSAQVSSKRKGRQGGRDEEDENDRDDVSDTFSDLYPAADFERLDLNNDWSDYEFEEMEDDGGAREGKTKTRADPKNKDTAQAKQDKGKKRRTTQKKPKFVRENKVKKLKL